MRHLTRQVLASMLNYEYEVLSLQRRLQLSSLWCVENIYSFAICRILLCGVTTPQVGASSLVFGSRLSFSSQAWGPPFLPLVLTWCLISFYNSLKTSPWDRLGKSSQVLFIIYKLLQSFGSKEHDSGAEEMAYQLTYCFGERPKFDSKHPLQAAR